MSGLRQRRLSNAANHMIAGVDANLGVLAANGGPTQTAALGPNSPAIGAGDPSVCANMLGGVDQRGATRAMRHPATSAPLIPTADRRLRELPQNVCRRRQVLTRPASAGRLPTMEAARSPVTPSPAAPSCPAPRGLTAGPTDTSTTVGGLTAGTQYTFTVYATNAVGAGEPGTTNSVTVKSPKPNAPTLALDPASDTGSSNSDGITSDNTPTFKGTADPGVTVSVFSDGGSTAICTDQAGGSGSWSCAPFDTACRRHAYHHCHGQQRLRRQRSKQRPIDHRSPRRPPAVAIDGASEPSAQTNATSATFTFTAQDPTDALSTYTCTLDGTASPCAGRPPLRPTAA